MEATKNYFKKEDSLCSCIFLNMDTTVSNNVIKTSDTSVNIKKEPYYKRVLSTVSNNNQGVMPILYIITLIITILSNWDKIKNLFS